MSVVAFTFGSFGDIATIIQLAWTIRSALSESSGSSAEIRDLIVDIDSFSGALQRIESALSATEPSDLLNGIAHALELCFDILRTVKMRIDSYQLKIANRKGVSVWRVYWAASAWEILGGKREVDSMKKRLFEQIACVNTLLAASQAQEIKRLADKSEVPQPQLTADDVAEAVSRTMNDFRPPPSPAAPIPSTAAPIPSTFIFQGSWPQIPHIYRPPPVVLSAPLSRRLRLTAGPVQQSAPIIPHALAKSKPPPSAKPRQNEKNIPSQKRQSSSKPKPTTVTKPSSQFKPSAAASPQQKSKKAVAQPSTQAQRSREPKSTARKSAATPRPASAAKPKQTQPQPAKSKKPVQQNKSQPAPKPTKQPKGGQRGRK